ncbi:MAG: pyruvate kinase [Alistipes sp.]|nr:pyruvate kinase [Alistipes sp.]
MQRRKKTKIVATLSDFRCTEELVEKLYDAGMDVVRINSAHASQEGAAGIVEMVHKVNPSIPIMLDTKGPEIRVTSIAEQYGGSISFVSGERVEVRGTDTAEPCTRETIYMNVPTIVRDIPVGARMLIADGEVEIRVVEKTAEALTCEFVGDGVLRSRKSVNVPGVSIDLPSVTEKDKRFIEWAVNNDVDFIAHSFVRSARDVKAVQDILDSYGSPIKIISKIENQEGLDNIDEIIEASYGIMVARGDLGVELPAEKIPSTQRMIVERCIAAKRPVIIATQMLYSMVHSPRPTRAEVNDVASAIYERVDAVMLSDETATGDYPEEAVSTMSRIARSIEMDEEHFAPIVDINMVSVDHEITAQVARSAVRACTNLPIRFIITDTLSGRTGRYLSAFRGRKKVLAVCYTLHAQRILALSYGVVPILRTHDENDKYHFLIDAVDFIDQYTHLDDSDLLVSVGGSFGPTRGASYVEIARLADIRRRTVDLAKGRE